MCTLDTYKNREKTHHYVLYAVKIGVSFKVQIGNQRKGSLIRDQRLGILCSFKPFTVNGGNSHLLTIKEDNCHHTW